MLGRGVLEAQIFFRAKRLGPMAERSKTLETVLAGASMYRRSIEDGGVDEGRDTADRQGPSELA